MQHLTEKDLASLVMKCNRCGFCQDVCPTYAVSRNEFDVARGRVRMLRMDSDGLCSLTGSRDLADQVDQCLLCRACVENCPSRVPTDDIMRLARRRVLKQNGFPLFHSLVYRGVLSHRERLERVSRLIRLFDRTGVRRLAAGQAASSAGSFLARAATFLPETLNEPARRALSKCCGDQADADAPRICYFLGCGTNVFTPDAALAGIRVLESLGFRVDVPDVVCCGGPHWSAGDDDRARTLARRNCDAITRKDYRYIVSDCATCTHTLHCYPSFFDPGDPVQESLARFRDRVRDINAVVLERLNQSGRSDWPEDRQKQVTVTYHDPCHAVRGIGGKDAPRDLLRALPWIDLKEMDGADSCCGGAGSYAFRHPEASARILERKVDAVRKTGAQVLATSCPSCILQLSAGLRRSGMGIRVMHPMELIAGNPIRQPELETVKTQRRC